MLSNALGKVIPVTNRGRLILSWTQKSLKS